MEEAGTITTGEVEVEVEVALRNELGGWTTSVVQNAVVVSD